MTSTGWYLTHVATLTALPNQSYLSGVRPFPTFGANSNSLGPQPLPSATLAPVSNPMYAQGVTGMQSETAEDMTGGVPSYLDAGGTIAGTTGDGLSAATRGATSTASGVADAASAGANAAGGVADAAHAAGGAADAAHAAGGVADAAQAAGGAADGLKGIAKGAGRALGPVAIGIDLVGGGLKIRDAWKDKSLTDDQRDKKVGEATVGTAGSIAGGAGGAWAGAAAGAAIGSVIPGPGTVIGGVVGAVLGGVLGGKAGEKAGEAVGGTGAGKGIGGFINNLFGK